MGTLLKNIKKRIGRDALDIVTDIVGPTSVPWLVITKKAVQLIGEIITKIPDRNFGFLSAFEKFGDEFEKVHEIDRAKDFSGDASLVYSWSID